MPQSATLSISMILNLPVSVSSSISAKVAVRPGVTPTRGRLSLATPIRPVPAIIATPSLVTGLMSAGTSLPLILAAELDRLLRRLCICDRFRRSAFATTLLVAELVIVRRAAQHLRRDVEQLLLHVHRGDIVGARLGRCGQAAGLRAVPGQAEPAVAAFDDHVLPADIQQVRRDPRRRGVRVGAEIADAGVDVQLAVRRDAHAGRRSRCCRRSDSPGRCRCRSPWCRSSGRSAASSLVPVEHRGALVQRLLQEGAGHRSLVHADLAIRVRRVDLADLRSGRYSAHAPPCRSSARSPARTGSRPGRAAVRATAYWSAPVSRGSASRSADRPTTAHCPRSGNRRRRCPDRSPARCKDRRRASCHLRAKPILT